MKKKNNMLKVVVLLLIALMATGCGANDYLKDENGKVITYEKTGQSVRKDILCKPNEEDLLNIYREHSDQLDKSVDELPACNEFTLSDGKYNGLFNTLLVKPLALLIIKLGYLINNFGLAVMIIGVLIRLILLPFSVKSMKATKNMQKIQPELAKLEKKYAGRTDKESMMAKSQETMLLYQKYKISPASGCLLVLIQIPIFFAFLNAIYQVPAIYEGTVFGMNLGMTPSTGIGNGNYIYLVLVVLIFLSTIISIKNTMKQQNNNAQTQEMMGQMKFMYIFMVLSITLASFSLPTAIALYWIVINLYAVCQNYIIKLIMNRDEKKTETLSDYLKKKEKKEIKDNNKEVIEAVTREVKKEEVTKKVNKSSNKKAATNKKIAYKRKK